MIRTALLSLAFFTVCATTAYAQQAGIPPVPENAFFVSRISGASLTDKLSIQEMDAMPVFGELFGEFSPDSQVDSFDDLGIDFSKDVYLFAEYTDSITYLFWTIPLTDAAAFKRTMLLEMGMPAATESPFTSRDFSAAWTDTGATFCFGQTNDSYASVHAERLRAQYSLENADDIYGSEQYPQYEYRPEVYPYEETQESPEFTIEIEEPAYDAVEEVIIESIEEEGERLSEIDSSPRVEEEYGIEDISGSSDEGDAYPTEVDPYAQDAYRDDYYGQGYNGYDAYGGYTTPLGYYEKSQLASIWAIERLNGIMQTVGSAPMISSERHAHLKSSKADASAFFDYGAYMDFMMDEAMGMDYALEEYGMIYGGLMDKFMAEAAGTGVTADLDFGTDEIVLDMDYLATGRLAEMQEGVFDSKLSKKYLKYMNSDDYLGFYTLSFNTEEMISYYTEMMSYYVSGMARDEDAGQLMADFLDLMLDEEGVAELFPGSMVITFSDIQNREVEYTGYEYNENFEYTAVTKTRQEMMPTFLAMVETERPEMVEKLLAIGVKQNEVLATDWGYELRQSPVPIYLQIKDDMLFIGNDLVVGRDIQRGTFKAKMSGAHKSLIRNNNTVMHLDAQRLMDKVQQPDGEVAELIDFMNGRAETMTIVSGDRGKGRLFAKMTMEVPEGEANGWSYLMHLLNSFYEYDTRRR